MESEAINSFIKDNWTKQSDSQLAAQCGLTAGAVRNRRRYLGLTKDGFNQTIDTMGVEPSSVPYGWLKSDNASIMVHNPDFQQGDASAALEKTLQDIKKHAPKYPKLPRVRLTDPHLLIINMTDLHVGDNTEVAKSRAIEGLKQALKRAEPFYIEQIVFVGGNDVLHVDTTHYTTTRGTELQGDMAWHEMFTEARKLYVQLLESCLAVAPVHYMHVLSNHDELMGWTLSQVIEAWFSKSGMTFDVSHEPRKFYHYGANLLAFTHGHHIREQDIPLSVATEAHELWGKTKHRYAYCGHVHHNKGIITRPIKEHSGIEVQYLRSSQERSNYERENGYLSQAGMSSFIHSPTDGQVARFNVNF